jgi:RNA polymerase sigma-70 factor (ECF subfamily)
MSIPEGPDSFPPTEWSLFSRARTEDPRGSRPALESLMHRYWRPIYGHIRRHSANASNAEDLTHDFFVHVLTNGLFDRAAQERGRFRCYILRCCTNFLHNRHRSSKAERNGGKVRVLSVDFAKAEAQLAADRERGTDPERQFLRGWAYTILDETFAEVEKEFRQRGRLPLYRRLKPGFNGDPESLPYRAIAAECGVSEDTVKQEAVKFRRAFREKLQRAVLDTLDDPADLESELRDLFRAVG